MVFEYVEGQSLRAYLSIHGPPAPPGDLPPWSTTLRILAIVASVLLLVGFVTEMRTEAMAHREGVDPVPIRLEMSRRRGTKTTWLGRCEHSA